MRINFLNFISIGALALSTSSLTAGCYLGCTKSDGAKVAEDPNHPKAKECFTCDFGDIENFLKELFLKADLQKWDGDAVKGSIAKGLGKTLKANEDKLRILRASLPPASKNLDLLNKIVSSTGENGEYVDVAVQKVNLAITEAETAQQEAETAKNKAVAAKDVAIKTEKVEEAKAKSEEARAEATKAEEAYKKVQAAQRKAVEAKAKAGDGASVPDLAKVELAVFKARFARDDAMKAATEAEEAYNKLNKNAAAEAEAQKLKEDAVKNATQAAEEAEAAKKAVEVAKAKAEAAKTADEAKTAAAEAKAAYEKAKEALVKAEQAKQNAAGDATVNNAWMRAKLALVEAENSNEDAQEAAQKPKNASSVDAAASAPTVTQTKQPPAVAPPKQPQSQKQVNTPPQRTTNNRRGL